MSANKWVWVLLVTGVLVLLGAMFFRQRTGTSATPSPSTSTEAAGLHPTPQPSGSGPSDANDAEHPSLATHTHDSPESDKSASVRVGLGVAHSPDVTELPTGHEASYVDPNSILRKLGPIQGGDDGIQAAHQSSDTATRKARAAEIEEALSLVQSLESKDQMDTDLYSRLKQEAAWLRGHPDP